MTDERKNEIWAMIPKEEQIEFQKAYDTMYECESYDMGFKDALERVFGYRNLTDQTEEKPKEPKFKVGDKVMTENGMRIVLKTNKVANDNRYFLTDTNGISYWFDEDEIKPCPSENGESVSSNAQNCTNPTENGISDSKIQSESAESVETSANSQTISQAVKNVDYAAHRLDLAKEIAVALLNNTDKETRYGDILAYDAVKIANEIVKRLKETDNAD